MRCWGKIFLYRSCQFEDSSTPLGHRILIPCKGLIRRQCHELTNKLIEEDQVQQVFIFIPRFCNIWWLFLSAFLCSPSSFFNLNLISLPSGHASYGDYCQMKKLWIFLGSSLEFVYIQLCNSCFYTLVE